VRGQNDASDDDDMIDLEADRTEDALHRGDATSQDDHREYVEGAAVRARSPSKSGSGSEPSSASPRIRARLSFSGRAPGVSLAEEEALPLASPAMAADIPESNELPAAPGTAHSASAGLGPRAGEDIVPQG